jgi:hypothetical protein
LISGRLNQTHPCDNMDGLGAGIFENASSSW